MSISKNKMLQSGIKISKDLILNGVKGRLIDENPKYMVVYFPGRTVYIDSINGSQYVPSEYVVYRKINETDTYYQVEELSRFSRAI